MVNEKYELLAPVGNFANLRAATEAGADAVYFGLQDFNMRASAKNFKVSDLKKIVNLKTDYDIIICDRKNKNRFLEVIISFISQLFFGLKDPLSGFKVYKSKILNKVNIKKDEDLFLVDFLFTLIQKNSKIFNYEITTQKRIGKSKAGGLISLSFKEIRILIKLFLVKFDLIK